VLWCVREQTSNEILVSLLTWVSVRNTIHRLCSNCLSNELPHFWRLTGSLCSVTSSMCVYGFLNAGLWKIVTGHALLTTRLRLYYGRNDEMFLLILLARAAKHEINLNITRRDTVVFVLLWSKVILLSCVFLVVHYIWLRITRVFSSSLTFLQCTLTIFYFDFWAPVIIKHFLFIAHTRSHYYSEKSWNSK